MTTIKKSVVIKKPIEQVFAYVQNIDNDTKWQASLVSIKMDEGNKNLVGSRFTEMRRAVGQEISSTLVVTAYTRNIHWAAKVINGPVLYEFSMTYTAVPEGTKITTIIEADTKGVNVITKGIVINMLEKNLDQDFKKLKSLLEST